MTETLQLDRVIIVRVDEAPQFLVEWSPRWQGFITSIGPALSRSGPRLAGEAPFGGFPYRGMLSSLGLQIFALFVLLALPREIDRLRPYAVPALRPDEVIYYSGDELPRTEDLSGSQSGSNGRAGGAEAHHRTQTIRVSRGGSVAEKVVDAPNLKLPASAAAVANLLALKTTPAPPSAEGLHSTLTAPALASNVIAPAPSNIENAHSRSITLNSVIAPAPAVSRQTSRNAPFLQSSVVPPAPNAPSDHRLIAPVLDSSIIAPAPSVSRQPALAAPSLKTNVVAPASMQISSDRQRATPALNASVVPPAPVVTGREVPATRVQMNNVAVVPPPVSAPERDDAGKAKLNLPAQSVVAPPPTAEARDLRRLESGVARSATTVVPPPPSQSPSLVSSIIGKIFGTQDVVPPPPSVAASGRSASYSVATNVVPPAPSVSANGRVGGNSLPANVVPPAPSTAAAANAGMSRTFGRTPASIVPPPPLVAAAATAGTNQPLGSSRQGPTSVIPPPPDVASVKGIGSGESRSAAKNFAGNVVPPPPSGNLSSATGSRGASSGSGRLGEPSVLAPPKPSGNSADASGVVLSAQPGSAVGVPGSGGKNSLAMSPAGGEKPGIGGLGQGASIGHGEGSGSGLVAENKPENSGAGRIVGGHGSDPSARAGISSTPGPGGAGSTPTGSPAVPGVDVRGGSTIVTLPSFGSDSAAPSVPGRSNVKTAQGPAITIVATSRSGGAFDFYGKLPGDNYTVYVDTAMGTVVMQFAEADPSVHSQLGSITGPEAIRADLPPNLPRARVVVKCKLDSSGNIRNLQVVEPGPAAMTAKIVTALPGWKFRPAMRGSQPVEVNAILGFNIDTNDRY